MPDARKPLISGNWKMHHNHFDDAIGDISLRDAIERQAHAGLVKNDLITAEFHLSPADEMQRLRKLFGRRRRGFSGFREVLVVAGPKRLYGRIEDASRHIPGAVALLQHVDQFRRRRDEDATAIEIAKNGIFVVERENHLEAARFSNHALDQFAACFAIGMIDPDRCDAAERNALPFEQGSLVFGTRWRERQEAHACGRSRDGDEFSPCRIARHIALLGRTDGFS